ncbi:MAG: nuclear transport factor 2 family protein, partial [Deltaproteobacteria bacterium]|nr:nuclear transport factor 2 family protein [Deltaproteobacteria bacterium]
MVGRVALAVIMCSIIMVSGVSAEKTALSQDEIAIRKAIESYEDSYNRGDASTAAAHWSRDGSYIGRDGERAKGPGEIGPVLQKLFSEHKGIQAKVALFDVQLQSPDLAISKGFAGFRSPGEDDEEVLFTATLVKENGTWKLSKVEEDESPVPIGTI